MKTVFFSLLILLLLYGCSGRVNIKNNAGMGFDFFAFITISNNQYRFTGHAAYNYNTEELKITLNDMLISRKIIGIYLKERLDLILFPYRVVYTYKNKQLADLIIGTLKAILHNNIFYIKKENLNKFYLEKDEIYYIILNWKNEYIHCKITRRFKNNKPRRINIKSGNTTIILDITKYTTYDIQMEYNKYKRVYLTNINELQYILCGEKK